MYANYRTIYKECRRERIVDSVLGVDSLPDFFLFIRVHARINFNSFKFSSVCLFCEKFYSLLLMVNKFHEKANVYF